jgi:uroporphyrinogen-III synthase
MSARAKPAAAPALSRCVLVTRPAAQAEPWVQWLRAQGGRANALPLIGIAPPPDPAPVQAAWAGLHAWGGLVFVSPNAAEQFFALRPEGARWPSALIAASPGPGTSRILRGLGVPAEALIEPAADSAQFDSESLWLQMQRHDWRGQRVLVVRGEGGRDWLAQALSDAGAQVDFICAYQRSAAPRSPASDALLAAALAAPAGHVWFFSSSESVDHLLGWCPGADWSGATALATHPRIAERARRAGFGRVLEAQPTQAAVWACLQSLAS